MRGQTRRRLQVRAIPDAHHLAGDLKRKSAHLAPGAAAHHPSDPMDRMFFNIIAAGRAPTGSRPGRPG